MSPSRYLTYRAHNCDIGRRCSLRRFLFWNLHRSLSTQEVGFHFHAWVYSFQLSPKFLAVFSLFFLDLGPRQAKNSSRIPLSAKWTSR